MPKTSTLSDHGVRTNVASASAPWLWVGVPFLILAIDPLRWCATIWFVAESQMYFQAWAIVFAILLDISRRSSIKKTQAELAQVFPDPSSPQRRGNLSIVLIGLLLLLIAYVGMIPPVAIIALIIVVVGMVYYLDGPFLVRAHGMSFLLLLLSIPWPSSFTGSLTQYFQLRGAGFVGQFLQLMGTPCRILGISATLLSNNHTLLITPSYSGLGVFFFVELTAFWWACVHRIRFRKAVVLLIVAGFLSIITSILRGVFLMLIAANNATLAESLYQINALPTIVLLLGLLYLISRKIVWSRRLRGPHHFEGPAWLGGVSSITTVTPTTTVTAGEDE